METNLGPWNAVSSTRPVLCECGRAAHAYRRCRREASGDRWRPSERHNGSPVYGFLKRSTGGDTTYKHTKAASKEGHTTASRRDWTYVGNMRLGHQKQELGGGIDSRKGNHHLHLSGIPNCEFGIRERVIYTSVTAAPPFLYPPYWVPCLALPLLQLLQADHRLPNARSLSAMMTRPHLGLALSRRSAWTSASQSP